MAWRETPRAQAARIRRTYRCVDCKYEFRWVHETADEPLPDCPACVAKSLTQTAPVAYVPPLPGVSTEKSRAIDITQKMAEETYGLTDFNDNQREGDVAFKGPSPMHTGEREAIIRELVQAGIPADLPIEQQQAAQNFWQGQLGAANTEQTVGQKTVASEASKAAAAMGVDPVGLLERGRETGSMRPRYEVVASTTGEP